jgi:hypothetical protein
MSDCKNIRIGAMLHAYELKALPDDDRDQLEIHLLECDHCFEELASFKIQASLLLEDSEIKRKIRASLDQSGNGESFKSKMWKYLWPKVPFAFRPLLLFIGLFILLIPATIGIYSVNNNTLGIQPSIEFGKPQKITLLSSRSVDDSVLYLRGFDPAIINFYFPEAVEGLIYEAQIYYVNNDSFIGKIDYNWDKKTDMGTIIIPLQGKLPGRYRLDVIDMQSGVPEKIKSFEFEISE